MNADADAPDPPPPTKLTAGAEVQPTPLDPIVTFATESGVATTGVKARELSWILA